MQAHKSSPGAVAAVPIGTVRAVSPVEAGLAGALVDVGVTEVPEEALRAGAGETPQGIVAGPPVQAWLGQALIDFQFAVCTCVGQGTEAVIVPYLVETRCPVQARI